MDIFVTKPHVYQDVKANLARFSAILIGTVAFIFYVAIIPPEHKEHIDTIFGLIKKSPLIGTGVTFGLFYFLGWLLIFMFEIHDKIYDRYIIKWREKYDRDFLLPHLINPYKNNLDQQFQLVAQKNMKEFMKIFYYYVGDYDTKIRTNLVLRFYERITKYWITQLNEIVAVGASIILLVYIYIYYALSLNLLKPIIFLIIIIVLFIINRKLIEITRNHTKSTTKEEIEDIHNNFSTELLNKLQNFWSKYKNS